MKTRMVGIAVFRIAFDHWVAAPRGPELTQVQRAALAELKAVAAGVTGAGAVTGACAG